LVAPATRRRDICVRPDLVPTGAVLQYLCVCTVMQLVHDAITHEMAHPRATLDCERDSAVAFTNAEMLQALQATLTRHPVYDADALKRLEVTTLRSVLSTQVHQLCAEAERANAHSLSVGRGVYRFRVTYAATRQHATHVLTVSPHALDDACLAFLEWCARVCAYLVEGWPLPSGATWKRGTFPRVSKAPSDAALKP
jgi:hypothetical protein